MSERPCSECRHYEKKHDEFPCVNCDGRTDYFNAEISLCRWIPCSERLPVPNEYDETGKFFKAYLVQTKSNRMHTALWDGTYWTIWTRGIVIDKVIAWMPLPEPYKESED